MLTLPTCAYTFFDSRAHIVSGFLCLAVYSARQLRLIFAQHLQLLQVKLL